MLGFTVIFYGIFYTVGGFFYGGCFLWWVFFTVGVFLRWVFFLRWVGFLFCVNSGSTEKEVEDPLIGDR